MDYQDRRGRRGKGHSRPISVPFGCHQFTPPSHSKPWSFLSGFYSFLIMSSLMAIIYLMLEYHCSTCTAKCDMNSISKNIDDIAKNLSLIKKSYHDLELKISKFAQELPRIEGQIDILEAFANTIESGDFGWNPKTHLTLPNVDVYLNKLENGRNTSRKCSKHLPNSKVSHLPNAKVSHLPNATVNHLPNATVNHLPNATVNHLPKTIVSHA